MNRELLEKPFPDNLIKSRKGLSGKTFSYVEGSAYVQRLNDAFDGTWSFSIVEHRLEPSEVIVLGKLTADGVEKMAFGGSSITISKSTGEVVSIADDLKAAATDSLKKACSLLGIGLHLYADSQPSNRLVPRPKPKPVNGNRLTQKQLSAIWSMGRNLGISAEGIRRRSMKAFNCIPEQLSKEEASSLITKLSEELDSSRVAS